MKRHRLPFLTLGAAVGALAAIAAIAVGWWLTGGAIAMPGPLSRAGDGEVHGGAQRHADLDCDACHTGVGGGSMAPQCLACHDDTRAEIDASKPLHGRLPDGRACLDCHTEHTRGSLTSVNRATFPHDASGFALTAHKKRRDGGAFTCDDCHQDAVEWELHDDRCAQCHKDDPGGFLAAHTTAYGDACQGCHDGVDRFGEHVFDHARTKFPLEGKHAPLACEKCHSGVKVLDGFASAPTRCVGCHKKDDVHKGDNGDDCAKCHNPSGWKPAKGETRPTTPATTTTGTTTPPTMEQAPPNHRFPLDHGGGGRVACATCHPNGDDTYTCFGCHEHTPSNVVRIHRPQGINDTHDCARCHPRGRI